MELWKVFDTFWATCKNNWKNSEGKTYPVDTNFLAKSWAALMNQGMGLAFAAFQEGEPVGLFLGIIAPDLHNGTLQGVEYVWAGKGALQLLDEFEKECRAQGCSRIVFGLHPEYLGERAPLLRRLYRRKGFKASTESFVKEL